MSLTDGLTQLSSTALLWLLWFAGLTVALYFARQPAHRAILSFSRLLYQGMRVAAASVIRAERTLRLRNREVLLAAGREAAERMMEREFYRIDAAVRRDLAGCPGVTRRMSEEVERVAQEYYQSAEAAPKPPGWVEAVNTIAQIPSNGDPMVVNVLESVREALVKAQNKAFDEYRAATRERIRHLQKMVPMMRQLVQLAGSLDERIKSLFRRAEIIDLQIGEYESILKQTDGAVQRLSSSSLVQFFVSLFVLTIAVGGAVINFHLIARPMGEMVGGYSMIGAFRIADVAALVIILVEISMGLFLMESLRITRLFPVIGALPDKSRVRMIWVTFAILFMLASVEAGLAYMREVLLQDELATTALLRGDADATYGNEFVWITTAAQMGMGFVLPFALVFVAIPLETFVHSLRTVLGMIVVGLLRAFAAILRVLATIGRQGAMLIELYDLLIFAPLWLDRQVKNHVGSPRRSAQADTVPTQHAIMKEISS